MMNYMQMAGATSWQIFSKLELPHALPSIFRDSNCGYLFGHGCGYRGMDRLGPGNRLLHDAAKSGYRTDRVFVAILVIVLLSLLMVLLITLLEKRLIRWNRKG